MPQFEFHAYPADDAGDIASVATVTVLRLASDTAACSNAGRLAKAISGPVDLAYAGGADWADRYISTARPSELHAAGYQMVRLDS